MARKRSDLENQMVDGYNVLEHCIAMVEVLTSLQWYSSCCYLLRNRVQMYTVNDYVSKTNHYAAAPLLFARLHLIR